MPCIRLSAISLFLIDFTHTQDCSEQSLDSRQCRTGTCPDGMFMMANFGFKVSSRVIFAYFYEYCEIMPRFLPLPKIVAFVRQFRLLISLHLRNIFINHLRDCHQTWYVWQIESANFQLAATVTVLDICTKLKGFFLFSIR
jgi:hypothetical protein